MRLAPINSVQCNLGKVIPLRENNKGQKVQNPEPKKVVSNLVTTTLAQTDENKSLGNGWYRLSPFLNGWVKVINTGLDVPSSVWFMVYVKEPASLYYGVPYKSVPKKSLIYSHILSKAPDKQNVLRRFENEVTDAFLKAKRFLSPIAVLSQSGLEITNLKKAFMSVRGLFGIEVSYEEVDSFLKAIENNNEEDIKNFRTFFKTAFVHEIVHELREEFIEEDDTGQEIASYAIQFLAGFGDNTILDKYLNGVLKDVKKINKDEVEHTSYFKDIITSLKLVQQKLKECSSCTYHPKDYSPSELNKAINSIPKHRKEKVLKKITDKILDDSPIELLRQVS